MLHLDGDLEQVGQEGKKRCEGEGRGEKGDETKLDCSLIVVVDKRRGWLSHLQLPISELVHAEMLSE